MIQRRVLISLLGSVVFLPLHLATADEILRDAPGISSADQVPHAFDSGLIGEPEEDVELRLEELLNSSRLNLKLRNYYLNRSKANSEPDPLTWAQGGSVEYKIGRVGGYAALTAEYFGSFKLYGPDEQDGALLLEPGQEEIDVLGVLNPTVNLFDAAVISAYRQKYDLPYVNMQDNRMIPNTFEGYTIAMTKKENEAFQFVAGYIDQMKKRDADEFISMSDAAGVTAKETGLLVAGARYYPTPDWSVGAINHFVSDVLNLSYAETVYKSKIDDDTANTISFQVSDQRTVGGEELLRGDSYSSNFLGLLNALSYKHAIFKLAYNHTDSGATMRAPFGSYPGYTSSIVEDFNRAGEKSWLIGLSYDFGRFDLPGLSLSTAFIHGFGAIDELTKENVADKEETDVTIDYRVQEGILKGLWFRTRAALISEEAAGTTEDYRIIVNYDFPLYPFGERPSDKT